MSGGGIASAFVDLGDKLHKNINQSIDIFGRLNQNREFTQKQLDENKRQFDRQFKLTELLGTQEYKKNEEEASWKRDFRNALGRGA